MSETIIIDSIKVGCGLLEMCYQDNGLPIFWRLTFFGGDGAEYEVGIEPASLDHILAIERAKKGASNV